MARFRLGAKHYLNVKGTEWERSETASNGKAVRHRLPVPLYLDPDDPADYNYPGEIIVATEASALYPRDIVFEGMATLDMIPLDDEAETLAAEVRKGAIHPIDGLPANGGTGSFSDQLLISLQAQVSDLTRRLNEVQATENDKLKAHIAELEAKLAAAPSVITIEDGVANLAATPGAKAGLRLGAPA